MKFVSLVAIQSLLSTSKRYGVIAYIIGDWLVLVAVAAPLHGPLYLYTRRPPPPAIEYFHTWRTRGDSAHSPAAPASTPQPDPSCMALLYS